MRERMEPLKFLCSACVAIAKHRTSHEQRRSAVGAFNVSGQVRSAGALDFPHMSQYDIFSMSRRAQILIALGLVVAIGIVCFAPSVDLEPTVMRAVKAASVIFSAIAAVGQIVSSLAPPPVQPSRISASVWNLRSSPFEISLVALNCARLC